jgi:hypothetical protein
LGWSNRNIGITSSKIENAIGHSHVNGDVRVFLLKAGQVRINQRINQDIGCGYF